MKGEREGAPGTPASPLPRRTLAEETLVVLSLSLLASAVFAILSLLEAPLRGFTTYSVSQSTHLVRRSGEGMGSIGLAWDRPRQDLIRGYLLFVVVGLGGIAVYLVAVAAGVNRFVVAVPPLGHWGAGPILLL